MKHSRESQRGLSVADRGAMFVEFSLVFLLLISVIIVVIEIGRIYTIKGGLEGASQDGMSLAQTVNRLEDDVNTKSLSDGGSITYHDYAVQRIEAAARKHMTNLFGSEASGAWYRDLEVEFIAPDTGGGSLADALQRSPMEIRVRATYSGILPFFENIQLEHSVWGRREKSTTSSLPALINCFGEPITSAEQYSQQDCPCQGQELAERSGESCVCRSTTVQIDSDGSGNPICACPNGSTWVPVSNGGPSAGTCQCDSTCGPNMRPVMNEANPDSPTCGCECIDGAEPVAGGGCQCPEGLVLSEDGTRCECGPNTCAGSGRLQGVPDPDNGCACSCDDVGYFNNPQYDHWQYQEGAGCVCDPEALNCSTNHYWERTDVGACRCVNCSQFAVPPSSVDTSGDTGPTECNEYCSILDPTSGERVPLVGASQCKDWAAGKGYADPQLYFLHPKEGFSRGCDCQKCHPSTVQSGEGAGYYAQRCVCPADKECPGGQQKKVKYVAGVGYPCVCECPAGRDASMCDQHETFDDIACACKCEGEMVEVEPGVEVCRPSGCADCTWDGDWVRTED